jgi:hypothetical protein
MADTSKPYTIDVPDAALHDLKTRLGLARFPDELDGAGWDLGAPLADIKRLTAYWCDEYDWRKSEKRLNTLPPECDPSSIRPWLAGLFPRRH